MSGDEEEWLESHRTHLRAAHQVDNWKSFDSAAEARFENKFERRDTWQKMARIK